MRTPAGVALVAVLAWALYDDPAPLGLAVRHVLVDGSTLVAEPALRSIAHSVLGNPMSTRTCRLLAARLQRHWAVERAQVARVWPHTLRVRLLEAAVVAQTDEPSPAILDRNGRIVWRGEVPGALPIIVRWTPGEKWAPALRALERLRAFREFSEGSVVPQPPSDGSLEVVCARLGVRMVLPCPPDERLQERLAFTFTVLSDMRARGERPEVVDLRWSNQIVVRGGTT